MQLPWLDYMADENQPNQPTPIDCHIFVSWSCMPNVSFLCYVKVVFLPKIALWLRKTKTSKQIKQSKTLELPWFFELSLQANFWLSASLIMFKLYFYGGRGKEKKIRRKNDHNCRIRQSGISKSLYKRTSSIDSCLPLKVLFH